ncbi:ATP-binding response regulator [Leptolyngbya sp. AN02str]|uniref:ATP-binding response regulator n=1 Tax=Leptolyngbya sp. AN02str TaxID=3423363 RepID=UPI003D315E1A
MQTPSLHNFIDVVPCVSSQASLAQVLSVFRQQGCDRLIVQQQPKTRSSRSKASHRPSDEAQYGTVSLSRAMFELLPSLDLSSEQEAEHHNQAQVRSRSIQSLGLIEAAATIPAEMEFAELQSIACDSGQQLWIVLTPNRQCLGLLNWVRLCRHLTATHTAMQLAEAQIHEATEALAQSTPQSSYTTLTELLEGLPLPLMVQTRTGEMICQNHSWRSHLNHLYTHPSPQPQSAPFNTVLVNEPERLHLQESAMFSGQSSGFQPLSHLVAIPTAEADSTTPDPAEFPEPAAHSSAPSANQYTCLCQTPNGEERIWQFTHLPLAQTLLSTPSSVPDWWLVLAQDVTEQHQVARELSAKNADLVQLNRLKDEFLACISHELKSPLTAVLGLSSLLKDHLVGPLNERQSRYASLIYQSGRHLMLIVNDILDLTRIETGQLELNIGMVKIEDACHRAYEQARQLIAAATSGVAPPEEVRAEPDFQYTVQAGLEHILADELRLRQMLANLLSNALKFTLDGGAIRLNVEVWEDWVAFTVADTGIGIPNNKQHLIFQKFQQLENPLTRRFEGTGLGLVLTQRLARLHGGDVTFTSTEGKGSQFTLLLPQTSLFKRGKPGSKPQVAKPKMGAISRQLVLLVEAVPQFLDDMTHTLMGLGYRVAIARSGTEALEKARQLRPLAIFLNPLLPMLSGWDVLTLLKANPETRSIPVVVTATRAERGLALSRGASNFLSLPIRPEILQQTLESIGQQVQLGETLTHRTQLTILHLRSESIFSEPPTAPSASEAAANSSAEFPPPMPPLDNLAGLLHPYPCRVLEVDDLEQANLLARVWKPQLILLDGTLPNPMDFMRILSGYPCLAALPLVTLNWENTQAAIQMNELSVYPCLEPIAEGTEEDRPDMTVLLEVMEVAAGLR